MAQTKEKTGKEYNNGWLKLENKPKEIPIGTGSIELYNIETKEHYISTNEHEYIELGQFTHWKPIKLSKPPLK